MNFQQETVAARRMTIILAAGLIAAGLAASRISASGGSALYWVNSSNVAKSIGTAGIDGSAPNESLVSTARTVDNHLQRVYGKPGVGSRAELAEALLGLEG